MHRVDVASRSKQHRSLWVVWMLVGALLGMGVAKAQSIHYVYDANGRIVAVTASDGTAAQYTYNALGHVSAVSAPLSAGQQAVFAFTPSHGVGGTQVTIQGQGFDSNAVNNMVAFNGAAATVLSAAATKLVVAVPVGATTGMISVTSGARTVTSATPFVIDNTGALPVISYVTPFVVAGGTVIVTGAHLDPIVGDTSVQMGNVPVLSPLSISDSQLQYTVPDNAVSGFVTVETPYGMATSSNAVAILPGNIVSASKGAPGAYLVTNGPAMRLSSVTEGQIGILTFNAHQGDNLELELSNVATPGGVQLQVYNPSGVLSATYTCSTTSTGPGCDEYLWNLMAGTYSVVVTPSGNATLGVTAQVQSDVVGPALTAGKSVPVTLGVGQVERFTFSASAGQNVALQLSSISTTPPGRSVNMVIYAPGAVTPINYYTYVASNSSTTLNLPNLPSSGSYTVVVDTGGIGFSTTAQLTMATTVPIVLTDGGIGQSGVMIPGQYGYLSFTANAGDNLELELSDTATPIGVQVVGPSGALINSSSCGASSGPSCDQYLWNLDAGTYSVLLTPPSGGTLAYTAQVQRDIVAPALTAGSSAAVSVGMGQVERFTFSASAGQAVTLNLSNVSTAPAGQTLYMVVYAPGAVTPTNYYRFTATSSSAALNLTSIPSSGVYTVVIDSGGIGFPATAQLLLSKP